MYFENKGNNKILFAEDSKFKNFKVILSFKTPLDKKTATLNASCRHSAAVKFF